MADDIRFSVNFWTHPKTVKLSRKGGLEAVRSLQILWCFCAQERTDGVLSGMDAEDIEIAADWQGDEGRLVELLVAGNWLERLEDGTYALHGWEERQAYVSKAESRKEQARVAAEARWRKRRGVHEHMPDSDSAYADSCEQHCSQHNEHMLNHADSNAPFPAPLPDPLPDPKHSEDISGNQDRARARKAEQTGITETGDEPSIEFIELREMYSRLVRSEGKMTGFIEFKQARAARTWPGLARITDDINKRLEAGVFRTGYGPSLRRYLTERFWETPVPADAPTGRTRDAPAGTLAARNMATARKVLEEMEAGHDRA